MRQQSLDDTGTPKEVLAKSFATVRVEKVIDITFRDAPEAFFVSVLAKGGELFASYRTTLSSWETVVTRLNHSFAPIVGSEVNIRNTEDARFVEVDGEGWLIDNHFLQPRAMTTLDGSKRLVLDTSALGANFDRGKNWSPFVYKDKLFFVYSLSPLRVLACDMPSGKLEWAHGRSGDSTLHGSETMNLNDMLKRGGTNGVVHSGHVYGIGRETKYEAITCSGVQHQRVAQHYPFLWRFPTRVLDVFLFEKSVANETTMTAVDSTLVVNEDVIEFRQLNHPFKSGVNDPASIFVHNATLYMTVSSCSCACLPEFRNGNAWQRNGVFRLVLQP